MEKNGVYILHCSNGRFYTGCTSDLKKRIVEHRAGEVKSTRNLLPLEIKAFIQCDTMTEARKLERKIKDMKSRKYLEDLIVNNSFVE